MLVGTRLTDLSILETDDLRFAWKTSIWETFIGGDVLQESYKKKKRPTLYSHGRQESIFEHLRQMQKMQKTKSGSIYVTQEQ